MNETHIGDGSFPGCDLVIQQAAGTHLLDVADRIVRHCAERGTRTLHLHFGYVDTHLDVFLLGETRDLQARMRLAGVEYARAVASLAELAPPTVRDIVVHRVSAAECEQQAWALERDDLFEQQMLLRLAWAGHDDPRALVNRLRQRAPVPPSRGQQERLVAQFEYYVHRNLPVRCLPNVVSRVLYFRQS